MEFEKYIEKLKSQKLNIYKDNYKEMVSGYKREFETTKSYNGRQLLELIQNCDDQGSEKILIKIDSFSQFLSISNTGEPFSTAGYDSLFIDNLSSKNDKKQYIGNKGLGFRSILNWVDKVSIISNNIRLTYSKEQAKKEFCKLFDTQRRKEILNEYNFKSSIIPIPLLVCPEIEIYNQNASEYVTSIEITYNDNYYDDIIEQIESIVPETLFFLKHIKEINFEGFSDKSSIICKKENLTNSSVDFKGTERITFGAEEWFIYEDEGPIPEGLNENEFEENEFYQIKIAIKENDNRANTFLYSFFPTQVKVGLPYIIHATFDLDPTRKHLNNSKKNKFIVDKIVALIIRTAQSISGNEVSWKPYSLLKYKDEDENLKELGFYKKLDDALESVRIYPCISNQYRCLDEVVYISDSFSECICRCQGKQIFDDLLIPMGEIEEPDIKYDSYDDIENKIELLQKGILNLEARVDLIYLLNVHFKDNKFELLLDKDGKNIEKDNDIYTPATNKEVTIPGFCPVTLLQGELFKALVSKFKLSDSRDPARELQRRLSSNYKIHSYEPHPIAEKIISSLNKLYDDGKTPDIEEYIKEAVKALYNNYKLSPTSSEIDNSIYLVNKSREIVKANQLCLSAQYPTGKYTEIIFSNYYSDENYLCEPEYWEFDENDEIQTQEIFFVWLGVNEFAKYTQTKDAHSPYINEREYVCYIHNEKKFNSTQINVSLFNIVSFNDILSALSIERLLLWIAKDYKLKQQLDDGRNTDIFKYYYRSWNLVSDKESFLKYQINKKYNFNDFLIVSKRDEWINSVQINYDDPIFKENNIGRTDIHAILKSLNAKEEYTDLSISKIGEILRKLPGIYSDGRNSQAIYKNALSHYKEHKELLPYNVDLFASDGGKLSLCKQSKIYYSDKTAIPLRLRKHYPIFNFPPRSGGAEAIKFFRINDLKNVSIHIEDYELHDKLNTSFITYLTTIKPLLLALRIHNIEKDEQKRDEARRLKGLEIKLCYSLIYRVDANKEELENYEYIFDGTEYFIKVNKADEFKDIFTLKFSQSLAEIISQLFNISDKTTFQLYLKENIAEIKQLISEEYGVDNLIEAEGLLGMADPRASFELAVLKASDKDKDDEEALNEIKQIIAEKLGDDFDYIDLNSEERIQSLSILFNELSITIADFNKFSLYEKIDLEEYHLKSLETFFFNETLRFKYSLWKYLWDQSFDEKKKFLHLFGEHEKYPLLNGKQLAGHHKNEFEFDVESIYKTFLNNNFPYLTIQTDFDSEYDRMFILEKENRLLFKEDEKDVIDSRYELRSLLYFKDTYEEIKSLILEQRENEQTESNASTGRPYSENSNYVITSKEFKKPSYEIPAVSSHLYEYNKGGNSGTHRSKKQIGNDSEDIVFNELLRIYKNSKYVIHASKNDEGLHYDIRYSNDEGKNWIYVEVKTFARNYFKLSAKEKEFGVKHKDQYEVWLVDGWEIHIIKDLFSDTTGKYEFIPNEYIICLKEVIEEL